MSKKLVYLSICILLIAAKARAQQVEQGFEVLEIMRLTEVYGSVPNLSFNVTYSYADSATPNNPLEQIYGSSKISYTRFWIMLDSIEFVQGQQYSLSVDYQDSTITIAEPITYKRLVQLPVLDSLFRQANVQNMRINVQDSTTRVFSLEFKPNSAYSGYKLYYDPVKYLVKKVDYFLKDVPVDSTGTQSGTAVISMAFSNYSEQAVDPSIYIEDRFVYRLNGQFYTKPAYSNFRIISAPLN